MAKRKSSFENEAYFLKREDGYKLVWTDALIYSDNIYFAKAALKIGADFSKSASYGMRLYSFL